MLLSSHSTVETSDENRSGFVQTRSMPASTIDSGNPAAGYATVTIPLTVLKNPECVRYK